MGLSALIKCGCQSQAGHVHLLRPEKDSEESLQNMEVEDTPLLAPSQTVLYCQKNPKYFQINLDLGDFEVQKENI